MGVVRGGGGWGGRGVFEALPLSHRQAGPSTASVCSSSKGLGGVPQGGGGGGGGVRKFGMGGRVGLGEGGPIRVCLFQTLLGRKPRRILIVIRSCLRCTGEWAASSGAAGRGRTDVSIGQQTYN